MSRDIFPATSGGERNTSFKLGMGRNVELSLKHELDVLSKKTLVEIGAIKELARKQPINEEGKVVM